MKVLEPTISVDGPIAFHNQRCAVAAGEKAVYCLNDGVFLPSWKAQSEGWRLVKIDTWFKKLIFRFLE